MRLLVGKLASVYYEELALYQKVLELVEGEKNALVQCQPLGAIIDSLKKKRTLLNAIESMDKTIVQEKEEYQRYKTTFDAADTSRLNETVKAIKQVIRRIMEIEGQNEETILAYGGPAETAGAVLVED